MNIIEIRNKFPDELSCIEYAESIRWEHGVECPYCESDNFGERNADHRYHCKDCQRSFSVTVKTVLHDTRLPISTWFSAISMITDAKKGLSAKQLERNIGVSYPTAFKMYHTLRDLMEWENPKANELTGIVEMDETFIGGKPRKMNEDHLPQKKREHMDAQIKELKEKGFKFKRKRGNPAIPDLNPKRGRGTSNIKVAGIVERNGNVVAEVMAQGLQVARVGGNKHSRRMHRTHELPFLGISSEPRLVQLEIVRARDREADNRRRGGPRQIGHAALRPHLCLLLRPPTPRRL